MQSIAKDIIHSTTLTSSALSVTDSTIITNENSAMEDQLENSDHLDESLGEQQEYLEKTLLIAGSPALVSCLVVAGITVTAVLRSGLPPTCFLYQNFKLWKTRHILQVKEK